MTVRLRVGFGAKHSYNLNFELDDLDCDSLILKETKPTTVKLKIIKYEDSTTYCSEAVVI